MLPSWCQDTVTVLRAQQRTVGTRTERDWANAQSHVIKGCSVQPSGTSSAFGTVDAVSTADTTLYLNVQQASGSSLGVQGQIRYVRIL